MVTLNKATSTDEHPPLHGDVLEAVLSHVPLIHLLPASMVTKSWSDAVSSAVRTSCKLKPWLILHTQSSIYPYPTTTHAYDPTANLWIEILRPPTDYFSTLRSSQSDVLYMLSPSKMALSSDPLHLTWHHAPPPKVWRIDPVVAVVGKHVVVAGGVCDFEDDPLAVEVYDFQSRKWTRSEPVPEVFSESAASLWLSFASDDRRLFVMEKRSGVTHSFDPSTNSWSGPYDLRPDPRIFSSVIGFTNGKLVLIGILGKPEDVDCVKIWQVNCDSYKCEEIGEIPTIAVANLQKKNTRISSIDVSMARNLAYIYISSLAEEVIVCEFIDGGRCRWCSVKNPVAVNRILMHETVITCSKVGMEELQRATRSGNRMFVVKR